MSESGISGDRRDTFHDETLAAYRAAEAAHARELGEPCPASEGPLGAGADTIDRAFLAILKGGKAGLYFTALTVALLFFIPFWIVVPLWAAALLIDRSRRSHRALVQEEVQAELRRRGISNNRI